MANEDGRQNTENILKSKINRKKERVREKTQLHKLDYKQKDCRIKHCHMNNYIICEQTKDSN